MNLVLIETSGNQHYIFATNKLRENVGASELTYRVGTQLVLEAVKAETSREIWEEDDLSGSRMRANLLDRIRNPELKTDECLVEVITATSGKALLLVEDREVGRRIIRTVTERALRQMPGLTVHGAISEPFGNLANRNFDGIHERIKEVHRRLEYLRYSLPGNEQRFLRLPFVAPCATSGLPARHTKKDESNKARLFSELSFIKRETRNKGYKRIKEIVAVVAPDVELIEPEEIENCEWVAVVHADGNGLGEIFRKFNKYTGLEAGQCTSREYIDYYRRFSLALDACTINAAGYALKRLHQRFLAEMDEQAWRKGRRPKDEERRVPVVPLILGGDDLTILCDGRYALKFIQDLLAQFEAETTNITDQPYLQQTVDGKTVLDVLGDIVPQIAQEAFDVRRLSICAGAAIVKPHFPFHQAYELAEALLKSAKQVKDKLSQRPCSALDYHILYDSTISDLAAIRDRLKVDEENTWLYARPYVISESVGEILQKKLNGHDWLEPRLWKEIEKRVAAMLARSDEDEYKRKLPNSQLHTLRESLFLGKAEADARARLIQHRYADQGFCALLCRQKDGLPTLFFEEEHDGVNGHATHFMDALDIIEFRKGEEVKDGGLADKQRYNTAR